MSRHGFRGPVEPLTILRQCFNFVSREILVTIGERIAQGVEQSHLHKDRNVMIHESQQLGSLMDVQSCREPKQTQYGLLIHGESGIRRTAQRTIR